MEELKAKIEDLENRKFLINMSDRLSREEKDAIVRIDEQIAALKRELEKGE